MAINLSIQMMTSVFAVQSTSKCAKWFTQPLLILTPPPFHWTAIPLRSWQSRNFSKFIPNRRKSVDATRFGDLTLPVRFHFASTTLPIRSCYDPTTCTTLKIWLRLVYADVDVAATLLRPWQWSYMHAFFALLYPFILNLEFRYASATTLALLLRFYRASTALLPFLLRFVSFWPKFWIVAESPSSGMGVKVHVSVQQKIQVDMYTHRRLRLWWALYGFLQA